mgnify:CR=1 FL=1
MQNVSENVKKRVQDAAYIAVGVGVLGAQQAQERAAGAQTKFEATAQDARSMWTGMPAIARRFPRMVKPGATIVHAGPL